jgi:hypothetical protein
VLIEIRLEMFVCVIDAQLFKRIVLRSNILKSKNIQNSNVAFPATFTSQQRLIDSEHNPMKLNAVLMTNAVESYLPVSDTNILPLHLAYLQPEKYRFTVKPLIERPGGLFFNPKIRGALY